MKSIKYIPHIKNSVILLRVDVNEPVDDFGVPQDDFRLRKSLYSVRYLVERGAKVVLLAHLGSPEGKRVKGLQLDFIAHEMSNMLGQSILKLDEIEGEVVESTIAKMKAGEIVMLENVRFDPREKKNSEKLAYYWSKLADYYVNDAFSVSHREHTSISAITQFLPSFAGIQLMKEIHTISRVVKNPLHPAVAIVGGAKIETKLPVIHVLAENFEYVLVGGKTAVEYQELYGRAQSSNVMLPLDYRDETQFDIGPKTVKRFCEIIDKAATIVWNGPMGKIEDPQYEVGTTALVQCISKNIESFSLLGGGETVDEVYELHKASTIDFISTGGGAMLEFIAKDGQLPGLIALEQLEK